MTTNPADFLSDVANRKIDEIKETDLVVGIPSYNNSRTISHVVKAVNAGLSKYFPHAKCVLINSDGGSKDGTADLVRHTEVENLDMILIEHPVHLISKIITPYHGLPGKGSAFRTIFKIAEALNAKACCVVDSDLRSITPEWIELLLDPILEKKFDYVAPLYARHKFDGTITNSIVYPMTRALYGKQIRQPIGGEFGFSGKLASHYLSKNVWESDVARFGIDIWMTTTAIGDGFKVCQSYLGAKIHDAKDPGADLTNMFVQVIGSLFALMEHYAAQWQNHSGSEPVPTFGFTFEVGLEPINVNIDRMITNFRLGMEALAPILSKILSDDLFQQLNDIGNTVQNEFHFSDELWVKSIYNFALACHRQIFPAEQLMKSMIPLYMGRIASFVLQHQHSSAFEVEQKIEDLCRLYEQYKPLLAEYWQNTKLL
ncbi:MAG: glycosyl transferase family 2 [Caldithrix sp.]|nr:glycosyl transferase family 2 [Caldithrix sp.]